MKDKDEDQKKRAAQQAEESRAADEKKAAQEAELAQKETALKKKAQESLAEPEKTVSKSAVSGGPVTLDEEKRQDGNWQDIIADYNTQFKKNCSLETPPEFDSRDDAVNFMEKQAEKGREFLVAECEMDGTRTGFRLLSCGNGRLYRGHSLEELRDALAKDASTDPKADAWLKKIEEKIALQQGPSNPTTAFREQVKDSREAAAKVPEPGLKAMKKTDEEPAKKSGDEDRASAHP